MAESTTPPAGTGQALRGTALSLGYGHEPVLDGVSVSLTPGCVTALVGPNGSGKSTLLRALSRLHPLASGTVTLTLPGTAAPRDITLLSPRDFARRVTLFTQSRPTPDGLTVAEVIAFGRHPHRRRFAGLTDADRAAVDHAMEITGLSGKSDHPASTLSGGEMQRVWLGACLAQDTDVLLLDEPTNHLDLRYQTEILDLVRDLADVHGTTVGVVLHDLDHALRVADEVLLLCDGGIRAAGPAPTVFTAENIGHAYGIAVDVGVDPRTGRLRIDPVGRHPDRGRIRAPLP